MRKHLTIRGLPPDVAEALEHERVRRAKSLEQTVIELLRAALGLVQEAHDNGLGRLAATWSAEELEDFERAIQVFGEVDPELWS